MSTPVGSSQWMYTPASGFYPYLIDQSLRYNSVDTLAMKRTPSSAGDRQTWSVSIWLKRGKLGVSQMQLLEAGSSGGYSSRLFWYFDSNDKLVLSSGTVNYSGGNQVFRDVGSWYHILIRCTGGSVTHYVNGLLDKTQALAGDTAINSTVQHGFGTRGASGAGDEFDGYLAQYALFDGTAYTFSDVTETINGIVVPKDLSALSYGTNGFLLDFADSANVGTDAVGSNDMDTVSGFVASDVVPDSPTGKNFATLNPLQNSGGGGTWYAQATLSEGNLKASLPANSVSVASMKGTGKLYAEVRWSTVVNELALGLIIPEEYTTTTAHATNTGPNSWRMAYHGYSPADIFLVDEGTSVANPAQTVSVGDIFQVAWDTDNGNIWFGYNNNWYDSSGGTTGNPSTGANPTMTATTADLEASLVYIASGNSTGVGVINFGQDGSFATGTGGGNADANGIGDFFYAPPSGFLALCSANLPEPTIGPNSAEQADDYFNTVLYTGNGSTQSITGVGFQPNLIWAKERSSTSGHTLLDTVRGVNLGLESNSNAVENDYPTDAQTSFDADGFSLGSNGRINESSQTYVAWNWKAGGTAVSNTDGTITSSVSAAPDAGFSIVSYTGTGANATVGHGLSSAPEMVIVKRRDSTGDWLVWNLYVAVTGSDKVLFLNTTDAQTVSATNFNSSSPTDSVINIGTNPATNASSGTHIAYCFHSVEGYSKVGKYVGNANADGTFVYTGFRPAFVILKASTVALNWLIYDNARNEYNVIDNTLYPNQNYVEATGTASVDFLSNGFKIRNSGNYINQSGQTFIYLAFAEAPAKYSNAR